MMPAANAALAEQRRVEAFFARTNGYWTGLYEHRTGESQRFWARHERALALVDTLSLPTGARVVDIGAGAGATSVAMARRGFIVDAVDVVDEMIERIEREARQAGVVDRVRARRGDAYALPVEDSTYSLVLMLGVIPWLRRPEQALAEVARVIEPGGWLIATCANRHSLLMALEPMHNPRLEPLRSRIAMGLRQIGWRKVPPHGPRPGFHSLRAFDRLLGQAGFQKQSGQTLGFGPLSCFNHHLPDRFGLPIDRRFQAMADRRVPIISSMGVGYLVLAQRAAASDQARAPR